MWVQQPGQEGFVSRVSQRAVVVVVFGLQDGLGVSHLGRVEVEVNFPFCPSSPSVLRKLLWVDLNWCNLQNFL